MNFKRTIPVLVLLILSACAQNKPVPSENTYVNPALDLAVEKPDGWVFTAAQEGRPDGDVRSPQNEESGTQTSAAAPTVAITKYPEPHPAINPTFQVQHVVKPSPELTPEQLLEAAAMQLQMSVGDFDVTEPLQSTTLSGHPGAMMEAEYLLQAVETGEVFAVRTAMWVVERDDELFIISMSGPADGNDESAREFSRMLSSVSIGG